MIRGTGLVYLRVAIIRYGPLLELFTLSRVGLKKTPTQRERDFWSWPNLSHTSGRS